jgi:hypothetical protein
VTRALWADERLMLRAYSLTLALASRNEGLAAAVERERVKVREVEVLGADVARIFTAARDMSGCGCLDGREKKRRVENCQSSDFPSQSSPNKSDPVLDVGPRIQQRCLGSSHKKWEQRYSNPLW